MPDYPADIYPDTQLQKDAECLRRMAYEMHNRTLARAADAIEELIQRRHNMTRNTFIAVIAALTIAILIIIMMLH